MTLPDLTRYELPPQGITLLGYIVRRMHKTRWLSLAVEQARAKQFELALAYVGIYAALSSTSYGPAYYQPSFNRVRDEIREADPHTGWEVSARLEADSPHYLISYHVCAPDGSIFSGQEEITGTNIGLRGLGMPAPSRFEFQTPVEEYCAKLSGIITSELALSLFGRTKIRAYGFLNAEDNRKNQAKIELDRQNRVKINLNGKPIQTPILTS